MKTIELKRPSIDLTGGDSVYCINEAQMKKALTMLEEAGGDSRLKAGLEDIKKNWSRNEQAALAFLLVEHLRLG